MTCCSTLWQQWCSAIGAWCWMSATKQMTCCACFTQRTWTSGSVLRARTGCAGRRRAALRRHCSRSEVQHTPPPPSPPASPPPPRSSNTGSSPLPMYNYMLMLAEGHEAGDVQRLFAMPWFQGRMALACALRHMGSDGCMLWRGGVRQPAAAMPPLCSMIGSSPLAGATVIVCDALCWASPEPK